MVRLPLKNRFSSELHSSDVTYDTEASMRVSHMRHSF